MKKNRFKNLSVLVILFFIIPLVWQVAFLNLPTISNNMKNDSKVRTSAFVGNGTSQWLSDTGFDYPSGNWTSSNLKDPTDVDASISDSEANLIVTGDIRTYSDISGVPLRKDWIPANNTEVKLEPDNYYNDSYGLWVDHTWTDPDDADQLVAIQWDRNVSLPVDMTDYNITSVSLSAMVNATVHSEPGDNTYGGIDIYGEKDTDPQFANATGDFVLFYIHISDIYKDNEDLVGSLKPNNLGEDNGPMTLDTLDDTYLNIVSEETIRNSMKTALETDPEHKSFTISIGILVLSEDDWSSGGGSGSDEDIWDSLRIKECNFSFTYEKIIDQLCGVSWVQGAEKISEISEDYYVQVTGANLNFYYKINETWPTSSSPSSEIRCLINNNPYPETVKLSLASAIYQKASITGFDVTGLIIDEVEFAIQLYLRDEFELNRTIKISIDNVSLIISYDLLSIETIPSFVQALSWLVVLLAIALIAVGSYFVAYQTYLKYPKFVRLIRGLRKRIRKGRSLKNPVLVRSRERIVKKSMREKMKILRIEPGLERAGVATKSMQGAKQIDINKNLPGRKT